MPTRESHPRDRLGALTIPQAKVRAIEAPLTGVMRRRDTRIIARPGWFQVVTPSSSSTMHNEVTLSRVAREDAERTIDEVMATYGELGVPTKWCVGEWTEPTDFGDRLARRGFASWSARGMAIATSSDLDPDSRKIIEIDDRRLDAYVDATLRGWSIPLAEREAERDAHWRELSADDRKAFFFAAVEGKAIVGTAAVILRGDYGYLLATQVAAEFRGRGFYRALVAERLRLLRERGITLAVTQAREKTSAPILEKLGFVTLFRSTCWQG